MPIVTRDSLQALLDDPDYNRVMRAVGRACVALYKRQTDVEQQWQATTVNNKQGFSATDAKCGTKTAQSFIERGYLTKWQVQQWIKRSDRTGYSRLTKYHRQLNEVAQEKQSRL